MGKVQWKAGTMLYPLPAVLVSCGSTPEDYNLITVAWTGTICSDPAMCYISLRESRHSYHLIKESGEFVINLTTESMARATDWCGVRSGAKYDKFKETGLHPVPADMVKAPLIKESPLSIECRVSKIIPLGIHHMFLAEVLCIQADEKYISEKTNAFHLNKAKPLVYNHGKYYGLGKYQGKFGFSVMKKRKRK